MTYRNDTWKNAITGLGTWRDKLQHTSFSGGSTISDQTLEDLYHNDDMAARVCDLIPDEMLRQGFSVEVAGDLDKTAKLNGVFDQFDVCEKLNEALVWSRVFGGAALFIGVDDGQSPAEILDLEKAIALKFISVLDRRELKPHEWYKDPLQPKFGQIEKYILGNEIIHESRIFIFQATRASKRMRQRNNGWSYSVLQRMHEVMQQFNLAWKSAAHLMSDAGQAVFKLKGLHSQIGANKSADLLKRMEIVDMSRSVARAILLDAEDEDFRRDSYAFSGIPELLENFSLRLAAAARIPVSLLMGQSPAGLQATGASDIRFFYEIKCVPNKSRFSSHKYIVLPKL